MGDIVDTDARRWSLVGSAGKQLLFQSYAMFWFYMNLVEFRIWEVIMSCSAQIFHVQHKYASKQTELM